MTDIAQYSIVPYSYQSECLGILRFVRASAKKMALVVMAGGLGKTITSAFHFKERLIMNRESRCLFLCHQNDILEQAQGEFEKVIGKNVRYGYFHGTEKTADAQIVFASFQTMRGNLDQFNPDEFDTIIVDETHRSKASTFEKVIRYFKPQFLLGITATPDRMDEEDIREIYGEEVFNLPLPEALARGLLSPLDYRLMTDEIATMEVLDTPNGRMSIGLLNKRIFIPKRDDEITIRITKEMAEVTSPKVIIYCSSVEHCNRMAKAITGAVPIHSKISRNDRRTRLELFRQGIFQVAVTVDMFNEALDIPQANIIVFLRSTQSPTIFFQQLCRGLRRYQGKAKVVVLDFVGNCERISYIYELWQSIKKEREMRHLFGGGQGGDSLQIEPFSLNVDATAFQERIVPLLEFIGRMKLDFYPTWQEAGLAAQKLNISNCLQYQARYREDDRLPGSPLGRYVDFPGWRVFLGDPPFYASWEEASAAALKLGITSAASFKARYNDDARLPSNPHSTYADFPGWRKFLKTELYDTWQEAAVVACRFGVKTQREYIGRYKEDSKLPGDPADKYSDFPGWSTFLGLEERDLYNTCAEASIAAQGLGIKTVTEYKKRHGEDKRLPASPQEKYSDFPAWPVFLGGEEKKFYLTCSEASVAAQKIGFTTVTEYKDRYMEDPLLPSNPGQYYPDFPGWPGFLGKV